MTIRSRLNVIIICIGHFLCQPALAENDNLPLSDSSKLEAVSTTNNIKLAKQSVSEAYNALNQEDLSPSQTIVLTCHFISTYFPSATDNAPAEIVLAAGKLGFDLLVFRRHQGDWTESLLNKLTSEGISSTCFLAVSKIILSRSIAAPVLNQRNWESDAWPSLLLSFAKTQMAQLSNVNSATLHYYLWMNHYFKQEHIKAYDTAKQGIELLNMQQKKPASILADLYNGLFGSQLKLGKFAEARISNSEALELKNAVDDERKWRIFFNSGLLQDYVGDYDGAAKFYAKALSVYVPLPLPERICTKPPGDIGQVAYALTMQGAIARKSSDFAKARKNLECSLSILQQTKAYEIKATQIELAKLAKDTNRIGQANSYIETVIQSSTTVQGHLINAWLLKCSIKLERSHENTIEPCLAKLASLLGYKGIENIPREFNNIPKYPIEHFQLLQQLMVYYHKQGKLELSKQYADAAMQLSEFYQMSVSNPQAWNSARKSFVEAYMDIVWDNKVLGTVNTSQLFELLEGPYSMEPFAERALYSVNDQSQELLDIKPRSAITSIATVQKNINSDEAFIRYFHYGHSLYALIITQRESSIHLIDSQKNILNFINKHSDIANSPFNFKKLNAFHASTLLPQKLTSAESSIKKLIIVPDRELEGLPFAALNISADVNEYAPLIRQKSVLFTSSASAYLDSSVEVSNSFSLALFGAPSANDHFNTDELNRGYELSDQEGNQIFPFLHGALDEVHDIAALFANSEIKLAVLDQATNEFLMSDRSRLASILHIATHGYLDPSNPNGVGIISASSKNQLPKSGTLSLTNLTGFPLSNQLVVISGCDTQQGKMYVGSGKRSMTRGFLSQGAGSVIGTLWPIQDKSTSTFMKKFYHELKRTGDSAEALRKAQEDFSYMGRYKAPKYWAGFVLNSSNKRFEKFTLD